MAVQGIRSREPITVNRKYMDNYLSPGLSSTPLLVWAVFTDIGAVFKVSA